MNANQQPMPSVMVGETNFAAEVLRSALPVLAVFVAPWSRPCQIIKPVLGEVAAGCGGRVKFVEINADDHPGLGLEYDVQSIPALLFFVAGTPRDRIVGTASAEAILAKCRTVFGVTANLNTANKQKL
jgi:thioredoxin-like negative regulator of GroEL